MPAVVLNSIYALCLIWVLFEVGHIRAGNRSSRQLDPSQSRDLSTLIVLNKKRQRLYALILDVFELNGSLFDIFARQVQRLSRINILRIFEPKVLAIHKQMYFAGIRFRINAVVEFNEFDSSKL